MFCSFPMYVSALQHDVSKNKARYQNDNGVANHSKAKAFPLLFGQFSDLRRFEQTENNCRCQKDKIGVDDKKIRRSAKHFPVAVCDGIAAGAQRRHQRGGNCHAGDNIIKQPFSGLSDDARKSSCRGN